MSSPVNPVDPAAVAGTGFQPVSVPPPGTERLVHAVLAAADPLSPSEPWLREAADIEDRHGPIRVGLPTPAATPLDDARWTTPIGIPSDALNKVRDLAGSGTPLHHLVNVAIYGRAGSTKAVKPIDTLTAFDGALTLVLATGQLAAEAMFQAGLSRAEIDDRITRFTSALHQASTSTLPVPGAAQAPLPSESQSSAFTSPGASDRRGAGESGLRPVSGSTPEAAVSASSAGQVTTPAPAASAT